MNGKKAKKIRQYYRRDFQEEARRQANLLGLALKPRTKYFPKWLWRLLARLYFHKTYHNSLYR